METHVTPPNDCLTMAEVRSGVDYIDSELCRLIGIRFDYMFAASRIKPERHMVRDEGRKAQVIENARHHALAAGWSKELAGTLWNDLVEASISFELAQFDARQHEASPSDLA